MNSSVLNCYQPNFTVLNDNQVLIDIYGGIITRIEDRRFSSPPTYLAIRKDGKNIYFYDIVADQICYYDPVSMALFHRVCNVFCGN